MMPPDPSSQQRQAAAALGLRVVKTRHDFHNSLTHILGFSEMLLEEAQEIGREHLRDDLELIQRAARLLMNQISDKLDAPKIKAGHIDLSSLQRQVRKHAAEIESASDALLAKAAGPANEVFKSDVSRIAGAAQRILELASNSLGSLTDAIASETTFFRATANPLAALLPTSDTESRVQSAKEGVILVVDDLEENRELLSRRLSRLGYSVRTLDNGEAALESILATPPDLILLDVLMPGLDGLEVLKRLKGNPTTQHIPVVMLSSADQVDTVVRCITLGADDFLPKPFNATLLMARIESSLSKKRLRDQEAGFLKRLQKEQEISERLLLNILPKAIAERLKQGETIIADNFPEVTVLFSDFVGFTKLSAEIAPKVLVGRLNEIFCAFDELCDRHGLEKIKMIGDAFMAVAGLPTPRDDHVEVAADMALSMLGEVARFNARYAERFRMRVGLNTGPVVAGVIGTKKFAYDLWGDTVNLASRMEAHAPKDGILATAAVYEKLSGRYSFKPGQVIRVKGKGEMLSYILLGKTGTAW